MAIARYKALSARRRRTDAPLDEETAATIADPADDPETVLLKKNRGELLRRSLASLSPEHGEVIFTVQPPVKVVHCAMSPSASTICLS
jgi:RNA polymerase sigma-70 factor (ECF subfamily)